MLALIGLKKFRSFQKPSRIARTFDVRCSLLWARHCFIGWSADEKKDLAGGTWRHHVPLAPVWIRPGRVGAWYFQGSTEWQRTVCIWDVSLHGRACQKHGRECQKRKLPWWWSRSYSWKKLEGAPRRARQTLLYSWYKTGHICKKKVWCFFQKQKQLLLYSCTLLLRKAVVALCSCSPRWLPLAKQVMGCAKQVDGCTFCPVLQFSNWWGDPEN